MLQPIQTITSRAKDRVQRVRESAILREFKEFAMRGNIIDLAIGIIIGGGFNQVVQSLVNDIIMPPVGVLVGRVDFASLYVNLSGKPYASLALAKAAGAPTVNYGLFLNHLLSFFIVAFVTFLVVKQINRWKRTGDVPPPPQTKPCPFCFSDIPERAVRCPQCTSVLDAKE